MDKCLKLALALGATILLLFPARTAFSAPSYLGTSGLIIVPDQRTAGHGALVTSVRFLDLNRSLDSAGLSGGTQVWSLNYGLLPNFEISFSQLRDREGTKGIFSGKYRTPLFGPSSPFSFTVGAIDLFDSQDFSPYAVVGYRMRLGPRQVSPIALNLTAGYGAGMFDKGLVAGAELALGPRLSLMMDAKPGTINGGLRFLSQGFTLDIGLLDMKDLAVGLGFGLALGGPGGGPF